MKRLLLVTLLAACGSSGDLPTQKPRGAAAYDGKRHVETTGLGKAPDGALIAATGDAERRLSGLRGGATALLVFYRGYW